MMAKPDAHTPFAGGACQAARNKPKLIHEYIGRVNSKNEAVREPGQTPEVDECIAAFSMKTVHRDAE